MGFSGTGTEAAPDDGDTRHYISGSEDLFQEGNSNAEWETRAGIAQRSGSHVFDMLLSGFSKVGDGALSSLGRFWTDGTNNFHDLHVFRRGISRSDCVHSSSHCDGPSKGLTPKNQQPGRSFTSFP